VRLISDDECPAAASAAYFALRMLRFLVLTTTCCESALMLTIPFTPTTVSWRRGEGGS
jgi:hypothetical protein